MGLAPLLAGSEVTQVPASGRGALPCGVAETSAHACLTSSYWYSATSSSQW